MSNGFNVKMSIPYTAFTSLTSGSVYSLFPQFNGTTDANAGTTVARLLVNVDTAFVFAPGTLVMIIGDDGDTARFFASTTIKTAGYVTENALSKKPFTYAAANTIDITLTAGAGALSSITAGNLTILAHIVDLSTTLCA